MPYQYRLATTNPSTSVKKAKKAEDKAKSAFKKAEKKKNTSAKVVKKLKKAPKNETAKAKASRLAKLKKAEKRNSADTKNYQRKKSAYKKASDKVSKVHKQNLTNKIAEQLEQHDSEWHNEGNCAIYPTDVAKNGAKIIYILPSDSENESNSANATTFPADKGTPRSSYARMNDRSITVEGIITGKDGDNAHDKYVTLRNWFENHIEVTYRGDIYYTHLIMLGLNRDFTDLKDDLHVSITFKYATAASISTQSGKSKKKSSKSSKTKSGKRTKKYTALTLKPGDTLWALSKKYGKSVKWLTKVNKIKDPNKISAGKKIRVR